MGRRDVAEPEIPVIKEDDQFMVKTQCKCTFKYDFNKLLLWS